MKKVSLTFILLWISFQLGFSQNVTIQVDASVGKMPISPYIFGGNISLSENSSTPTTASTWKMYRDAGLKIFRENGGNNATKYNWRLKMSSHPDWYNNVYRHDWDYVAKSLQDSIPYANSIWAFQLIGKVASNTNNNFNDYAYNQSQWWSGVNQNLAGGGVVNPTGGSKALTEGNPALYTMNWPADSTVGILDKWFGTGGLGLNKTTLRYWSMDNEPEIWNGTHDDVMPTLLSAEAFMQSYFKVAKAARAKFPEIKLIGPVPANEWQWYNWGSGAINYNGTNYCWLEYFIKRIGEEQTASGIKLLDVLDIHFYPGTSISKEITQLHRVFFDKNFVYPEANGVARVGGGWDASIKKEYIFERCNAWLTQYLGTNHGVTLSVSETGINGSNPNVTAVWYASTLGTFADNGVELFTPWTWKVGMWETLHLFSRYSKGIRVQSVSTLEDSVSGYSSINANSDSLTVFLVNRSITTQQNVSVKVSNMPVYGTYNKLSLYNLPGTETFTSHTTNALKSGTVSVYDSTFTATLPPLSITAVFLKKNIQPITIKNSKNPVCQGDNSIIYSIPQKQGARYKWAYTGTGATISNDTLNSISINYSNTATSGKLSVNAKYPADSTWTLDVTVSTPATQPGVITPGKDPVCKGDNNITYSVTNDPSVTYNWTYNGTGAAISNGTTNAISVNYGASSTSGVLTVTANNGGCSNSRTSTVTVNSLPAQPTVISASKSAVCLGDNGVTYSVTNDATVSYNWTYSGTGATITSGTTNAISVNYSSAATSGTLAVTATNSGGCTNSRTLTVTMNAPPAQPTVITASKNPVCQGENGITYSVTNDPAVTYNWTYSGTGATISSGTTNHASINYGNTATSGTLKVTVVNAAGCVDINTNNSVLPIIINALPAQPSAITPGKNPVFQGDNGITYSITNDPLVTYNWTYSGTGAVISNGTTNAISVDYNSTATSGNLNVVATNESGCANTNVLAVTVDAKPSGVNNITFDEGLFNIDFNSSKSEILISYHITNRSQVKIEFFDIQGRLINRLEDTFRLPGFYDVHFNHNTLAKGVYIIRFTAGQTVVQKKLLLMD